MLRNEDSSHTHPTADTHARHKHPPTSLLRHTQPRRNLPCARASKGMTHRNRTSIDIDLLLRDAKVLHAHNRLTRKRLVDLVEIDVLEAEGGELEDLGDGERRADAHDARGYTNDGRGDELAEDGEAEALGDGAAGEDDSCGAVGDLRSVTSVGGAVLLEGGLQLAETLFGDTVPDT